VEPERRILVVEDSASTRSFVRAALESSPLPGTGTYEITEASSGFEAMRLLPRSRWALVVTDVNMPDINGLELIRFIRRSEQHRDTPVLVISTQSTGRDVERGLALGATAFLAKPFSPEELRAECARLLGGGPAAQGG
jgi:two-component system chemotaxis response regulator CheY